MTTILHTVAVALKASVTGKGAFAAVAGELSLVKLKSGEAQAALSGVNKGAMLAVGGLAAMGAGLLALKSLKTPLDAAEKWQQAMTKFQLLGLGDAMNADAVKFAKGMDIIGSSYTDNLNMMREAIGVFRDAGGANPLGDAQMVAPIMAKLSLIDSALDDATKSSYHHQELAMIRFAEMSGGLNSPERMNQLLDSGYKAIKSSGGNVSWESLRQFKARAGAAGFNLSDKALFGEAEPLIGELTGSSSGTGLRTAFVRAIGALSIMPRNAYQQYEQMGLWDPKKVQKVPFGIRTTGNPLIDAEGFSTNPFEWYNKYVHSYYDKNNVSASDRIRDNQLLFGSTGANLFNLTEKQYTSMQKSVMAQAKMLGINGSYDEASNTLKGTKARVAQNYENLMITLGTTLVPMATAALKKFSDILQNITHWAQQHPTMTKAVMVLTATAGALLTIGGAAATFIGGFMLLAPAFTAIGAGIAAVFVGPAAPIVLAGIAIAALGAGIWKFVDFLHDKNKQLTAPSGSPKTLPAGHPLAVAHAAVQATVAHGNAFTGFLGAVGAWLNEQDRATSLHMEQIRRQKEKDNAHGAAWAYASNAVNKNYLAGVGTGQGDLIKMFLGVLDWFKKKDEESNKWLEHMTADQKASNDRLEKSLAAQKQPFSIVVNIDGKAFTVTGSANAGQPVTVAPTGHNGNKSFPAMIGATNRR